MNVQAGEIEEIDAAGTGGTPFDGWCEETS